MYVFNLCTLVNEESPALCAPRITRILALTLLVSVVVPCGCAHQYLMKLSNGDQIISLSKPKLQGTNCYFTGGDGVGVCDPSEPRGKDRIRIGCEGGEEAVVPNAAERSPSIGIFCELA